MPSSAVTTLRSLIALALIASPTALDGQARHDWWYAHRVRIATRESADFEFVGRVLGQDGRILTIDIGADTVEVPVASISRMEFNRGRGMQVIEYTGIGLLTGVAIGALIGVLHGDVMIGPDCEGDYCIEPGALVFGLLGGVLGSGVGFVAGIVKESWEPFDTNRLALGLVGFSVLRIGLSFPVL